MNETNYMIIKSKLMNHVQIDMGGVVTSNNRMMNPKNRNR